MSEALAIQEPEIQLIDYGTREAWLSARPASIGASESAVLFGACPPSRDSLFAMWVRKTGKIEKIEADVEPSWLKWGRRLEEPIARGYAEDSGRRLWRASQFAVATHASIPFMTATPDFWIIEAPDRKGDGLAEIKNVGAYLASDWEEGPPLGVQIQAQHQMAVTGRDYVAVVGLLGGNQDRPTDVDRNPEFIRELEAQVRWFWGLVQSNTAPPLDGGEATERALKKLHPQDSGETLKLGDDALAWWEAWEAARAAEKASKEKKKEMEAHIRNALGAFTFGELPNGRIVSLKTQNTGGYETVVAVEQGTTRILRTVSEKKKKGKAK